MNIKGTIFVCKINECIAKIKQNIFCVKATITIAIKTQQQQQKRQQKETPLTFEIFFRSMASRV
jgi:hypothetical protein